jgi:hypothetical protein
MQLAAYEKIRAGELRQLADLRQTSKVVSAVGEELRPFC